MATFVTWWTLFNYIPPLKLIMAIVLQIVYFNKLKAIKQLVELLKIDRDRLSIPPDTPPDLVQLIFSVDSAQLDGIEHNPFDVQWQPPTKPPTPTPPTPPGTDNDVGGFFCMPCFHR